MSVASTESVITIVSSHDPSGVSKPCTVFGETTIISKRKREKEHGILTWINAIFMRGGTSKVLFFVDADLPQDQETRDQIFCTALDSPDPFGRQLNGMGGGISSLSKIVTVAPSKRADADIGYTFGQVSVDEAKVDYSGNCGNLSSAVVPFALLAGIYTAEQDGPLSVNVFNINTSKLITVELDVVDGLAALDGDFVLPGVAGTASPIELKYHSPGGSKTGSLLPTSNAIDELHIGENTVSVYLVDAANPMVFVASDNFKLTGAENPKDMDADSDLMQQLDEIRRVSAVAMGLCKAPEESPLAIPKIAVVGAPAESQLPDGTAVSGQGCDVLLRTVSMGNVHRSVPGTTALCTAVAANIAGTLVARLSSSNNSEIRIATPSGVVLASAEVDAETSEATSTSLFRTARPLMREPVAADL